MRSRVLSGTLAALVAATGLIAASQQQAQASPPGTKDVTATLFQWKYDSVAKACTDQLGPAGYGFVEVSPATENIQGDQWWTSYQPVSYKLANRLGDEGSFKNMVNTCHSAGVKVVADAVINHMSSGSGTGTAGTNYSKYNYPGYYQNQDFHSCRQDISNYGDRTNVQTCELVGLADLDTGSDYVRGTIAGYLNHLISLGVDGFRIDAAKHMAEGDLAAIKSKLSNPNIYWAQEAIYGAGEAVQPGEYVNTGDVDAFQGAFDLKRIFSGQKLSSLSNWGASWGAGYLSSDKARTFVDNWDTERNGSTLSYKNNATYTLANIYMLAWPYGSPNVFSGYEFSNNDAGPPNGGTVNACYSDGWKCQHAWPQIANMVGFRNAVSGTGVTNWWDNGNNAIAFGRGGKGYVAINHEGGSLTRTFTTSLPAGSYCDVQHAGAKYTVGSDGRFTATIGSNDAVALYVGASCDGSGTGGADGGGTGGNTTGGTGSSTATVYYSTDKNWSSYYLHYAPNGGTWTTVPGVAMSVACTGWASKTVDLGSATGLAATFNNGSGTWDNNNSANYALGSGDITVKDGKVGSGNPCGTGTGGTAGGTTGGTTGGSGDTATGASFAVNATTVVGQNIYVVGDNATLGTWDPGKALPLSSASYPVWKLDVTMTAGTSFQYKYVRKDAAGNVTWESGGNRTATVPSSGKVSLNDTWRN